MFEFISDILVSIFAFFADVYHADERPEAQRFTLGCGSIVFLAIGFFILWMVLR